MGNGPHNGAFSIVRHEILDDTKFESVYDDDESFAWWLRLLINADKTFPAPAPLPFGVPTNVVEQLERLELIDRLTHGQYVMHGGQSEREQRHAQVMHKSMHARRAAWGRWHPGEPFPDAQ